MLEFVQKKGILSSYHYLVSKTLTRGRFGFGSAVVGKGNVAPSF